MAEHRRVEPRSIMGSGMSTDPERVRELEDEAERKARLWRERGEQSFGDVLKTAPARASLDEDEARERPRGDGTPNEPGAETAAGPGAEAAPDARADRAPARAKDGAQPAKPIGPRVPPDPRARALHRMLEGAARPAQGASMPKVGVTSETPPTGSVKNAPAPKKKGPA